MPDDGTVCVEKLVSSRTYPEADRLFEAAHKPSSLRELFMPQSSSKQSKNFDKKYISVAELAARWSVSQSAIYSGKCGSDALHAIRFGRSVRFLRSEVEVLERNREAQAA